MSIGCSLHRRLDHPDAASGSRLGEDERRRQVDLLRGKVNIYVQGWLILDCVKFLLHNAGIRSTLAKAKDYRVLNIG